MVTVYLRDTVKAFTEQDMEDITPLVIDSAVTGDGEWLKFDVPLTGQCENDVISLLQRKHLNLSRKYAEGREAFENVGMVGAEIIGIESIHGVEEEE